MAKAQLEISIVDSGSAPSSAPAAAPSSASGVPAPAGSPSNASAPRTPQAPKGDNASKNVPPPATAQDPPNFTAPTPVQKNAPPSAPKPASVSPVPAGSAASAVPPAAKGIGAGQAAVIGGVAGGVAGVVAQAAKESIQKILQLSKEFYQSLRDDVDTAAQFNGQVALAKAMSDVRMQLAEMNRAEQIGPQLAKFEELRSEAATALYDIVTEIKGALLNAFLPLIELIVEVLKKIAEFVSGPQAGDEFFDPITQAFLDLNNGMSLMQEQRQQLARRQPVTVMAR